MIPERYAPQLYALFRIVFGFLFLFHGLQKLFGMFGGVGGQAVPLGSMFGAAGVIELVCSVLIMLGLFTRIAAFIASGEMAAAYFIAHFPMGLVPLQNGGELAVLYCFAFLYIATRGPGMCSLDGLRR
ncbi:MAG TPA: DoxX family protein [Vicinamibacterales bacterium]|jgi:putative oxidoreductase|nr:DoxX family protein [Vicinamibacterales bacterium]